MKSQAIIKKVSEVEKFKNSTFEEYIAELLSMNEADFSDTNKLTLMFDNLAKADNINLYNKLTIQVKPVILKDIRHNGLTYTNEMGSIVQLSSLQKYNNHKFKIVYMLLTYFHELQHVNQAFGSNLNEDFNKINEVEKSGKNSKNSSGKHNITPLIYNLRPCEIDAMAVSVERLFDLVKNEVIPMNLETALILKKESLKVLAALMCLPYNQPVTSNILIKPNIKKLVLLYKNYTDYVQFQLNNRQLGEGINFDNIENHLMKMYEKIESIYSFANRSFVNEMQQHPNLTKSVFNREISQEECFRNFKNYTYNINQADTLIKLFETSKSKTQIHSAESLEEELSVR